MLAMGVLFGNPADDEVTGIFATNVVGTEYGLANFLTMDAEDAMGALRNRCSTMVHWQMWALVG